MKKRILAVLLALCMTTTMVPSTVLASSGQDATIDSAVVQLNEVLANGGEITLTEDIDPLGLGLGFSVETDVTINLNGHNIQLSSKDEGEAVFSVKAGGTLTINGEGRIGSTADNQDMAICADGGNVVINGGTYTAISAINGGNITINGGSFCGYDPSQMTVADASSISLASCHIVTEQDNIYTVSASHTITTAVEATEATCDTEGNIAYWICECGKWFSDENGETEINDQSSVIIPAVGHAYGEWSKYNSSKHVRICENDESHVEYAAHTYGSWKIVKKATYKSTGKKEKVCSVCGAKKTQTIAKLEGTGKWVTDSKGRWYRHSDGTYTKNGWEYIEGEWYAFDASGYMRTGWYKSGNTWYYLKSNGVMATGWVTVGGAKYYLNSNGAMQTGWLKQNGTWYYLSNSGAMVTGWAKVGNNWYYMNSKGKMQTGWVKSGGRWYYMASSGAMLTGWVKVDGNWYYFESSGAMATGKWIGNYYVYDSGVMATSTWIGNYYVDETGEWVPNKGVSTAGTWKEDSKGWSFKYASGSYAKNAWVIYDGEWYYLNSAGYMVTGWQYIGGMKYYFGTNGKLDQDIRNMVSGPYVIRVNRAECIITIFAKDSQTGQYIVPVKAFICSVGCPWSPTVTGTFYTQAKYSYKQLNGPTWGKWCTRIVGGYLFHSMPSPTSSPYQIMPEKYNLLGSPASGGCVRMTVGDAKWIYDNCSLGTKVVISDGEPTPFDKPYVPKISSVTSVDPAGDTY